MRTGRVDTGSPARGFGEGDLAGLAVISPASGGLSAVDARELTDRIRLGADAVLALRERLDRIRTNKVRTSEREFILLFVLSWNAFRQGRPLSRLQLPKRGLTAANVPVPR
ncbi:hypothetical protein [Nocardia nova]|uniref:hypothetical protein n=1 Tax=Nocardia nova TaxID=37330 RepID=UPI0033CB9A86